MNSAFLSFPKGFLWGAATSAHQIEGGNIHNDWWEAEQKGEIPVKSGKACDSYHRYEEDFDIAKTMHNNAHRFSIEWSRIEPEEGRFDDNEIEHYRKIIRALKSRGMEPFVTLHHFTLPAWFASRGGWLNKESIAHFRRYAEYVAVRLGSEARFWMPLNEPLVYINESFLMGRWPPFQKNLLRAAFVLFKLARAHREAASVFRAAQKNVLIGVAQNSHYFDAHRNDWASRIVIHILRYIWMGVFLDRIHRTLDFVGINYYSHSRIGFGPTGFKKLLSNEYGGVSDFGWEIYPAGIYHIVKEASRYKKPIYITENGIADADDNQRPAFIRGHILWLHKAIEEGIDVRGYFHWSLLDNFEWAMGYTMKFGLVEVNFDNFERRMRPSGKLYGEICRQNGLSIESF